MSWPDAFALVGTLGLPICIMFLVFAFEDWCDYKKDRDRDRDRRK